jgi:7,8-dihydropterin-6-yl-methyl-4-(beta-D-ribofuranosyl)aminobenzene 5'-phosphate synthase
VERPTRVICVIDDAVEHGSPFWAEHGLALLIERDGRRLLFDTGQSGAALLHNLNLLDIKKETIDAVAISHAHYDHTGGLPVLLGRLKARTPLYAHPDLFRARYSQRQRQPGQGEPKAVGLSLSREELAGRSALRLSAAPQEIFPGLWTTGEISERPDKEGRSDHHLVQQGESLVADDYRDEMALVLDVGDHLALLCGCCHAGLLNTVAHVQRIFEPPITLIAGGLHLSSASQDDLRHIGEVLAAMPALQRVYANHCTGQAAILALRQRLGTPVVRPFPAGTVLSPGRGARAVAGLFDEVQISG